jgi:hypothetical protein
MEAVDLTHSAGGGFGRLLATLSGGVEALYLFAGRGLRKTAASAS